MYPKTLDSKNLYFIIIIFLMFIFNDKSNAQNINAFYDIKINSIEGNRIDLNNYKNKVILLVNTASYCGFTKQYADLQTLWDRYRKKGLIVLGVPSNSFNQEKKDEDSIKNFCKVNFNIDFPYDINNRS